MLIANCVVRNDGGALPDLANLVRLWSAHSGIDGGEMTVNIFAGHQVGKRDLR